MKTHPTSTLSAPRRAARQPGLAIVVVVSLMALLMLLVLAFLLTSSTNRSISSTDVAIRQADSLADLAKETVIADLIGEMKDGSKNTNQNEDGTYSFDIEDPKSMVPFRAVNSGIGSSDDFNLIVKQSASGVKFSNGGSALDRASNVSTNTKDLDGRKIAEKRWSAPKLFPLGVDLTQNQVPDWIYTTRDGSNPTSFSPENSRSLDSSGEPSPDYVVGRYAYQVYDVSGLLDANVAGNVTASAPADVLSRKGSLVWADLSVLPNSGGNIAGLADWRRISSKNWPKGDSQSGVEDFIREWGGVKGWMKTPLVNNNSDNLFVSRKDLIDYQKANPAVIAEDSLRFFTTNSRALNRPSWAPTINAGNGFEYESEKDSAAASNRRIAGVLVGGVFQRRDKSQAVPGEPLVKTPFPLSKIEAFRTNNTVEIEKYFGLVQGSNSASWVYTAYKNDKIRTLEEVADEDREPNFFEILKAGLLSGSLANANSANGFFIDIQRDGNEAYQILRIGACIIDQWDRDDDPTIIEYGVVDPLTGVRSEDVAGIENLPYFHFLTESRFRRRDAPPPNDSFACTYINFQLWNPHRNPVIGKFATGSIRLAFSGTSSMQWNTNSSANEVGYTPYNVTSPARTATFGNDYIEMNLGSGASSFSTPAYLLPGVAGARANNPADSITTGGAPVLGYRVGEINAPYTAAGVGAHGTRYSTNGIFSRYTTPMSFALQKNINGVWVNYQIIPQWSFTHGFVIGSLVPNTTSLYGASGLWANLHGMLTDPRTTRHGISSTTGANQAINKPTGGRSYDNKFFPPANWTTPGFRVPEQYQLNAPGGTSVMISRDGKRRPTDGGQPFVNPDQRPEILNRPFQSVADMGLAFRDQPWTSLNFFGDADDVTNPGDGALLDLFSLTESEKRSGVINPNTAPIPVLETLISQAAVHEGVSLNGTAAKGYASSIRAYLDENPMISLGEIPLIASTVTRSGVPGSVNYKAREVIARALTDVSTVRTWNFLIDVVAQSGKISSGGSSLESFISQGEKRYWYSIAIDRITGEIIDVKREASFE
jgi:hypothetical protein